MIKEKLKQVIENAVNKAIQAGCLGNLDSLPYPVVIEIPKLPEHGDFACGIALKLAGAVKSSPLRIAESICEFVEVDEGHVSRFEVAPPGFINFRLGTSWLMEAISEIHQLGRNYGRSDFGAQKRLLIEYVSANPTGELHIGHGRGAVFGSCLANLYRFVGFDVEEEFYLNDSGEQIRQLGSCAWALYQRLCGKKVEYPEEGYPESSLEPFVSKVLAEHNQDLLTLTDKDGQKRLGELTMRVIVDLQRKLLETLKVRFDRWFSERTLHEGGNVEDVLKRFAESNKSYEADGALWLKAKELGDERDRVLKKSGGNTTYLAADAAYHLDKYQRGYDRLVTIWGADHHGQVPGLKAAISALGLDATKLEVILTQIVNLSRDGQIVRMSKRKGTVVTLEEVMEEVGVDAVRYYLAESNPQNPINFDLDLARKTSRENPAFYIQYAHARCCAILRKALQPQINVETKEEEKPIVSEAEWGQYLESYKSQPEVFRAVFEKDPEIFLQQKMLIMRLESFPQEVKEAAELRTPGRLARYAYELANDLQKFYEVCRVISTDIDTTKARLGLIVATRQVLANVLGIIGVSAPERM